MTTEQQADKILEEVKHHIDRGVYSYNPKSIHNCCETNTDRAVRNIALWYVQKMKHITEPFEGDYWYDVETLIIEKTKEK